MNAQTERTPYELLGGEPAVRRLAERFYDLMETSPGATELRAMHAGDLGPMREKLFDFLSGWLGGPPRYFERPDRQCMTAVHGEFAIGARERDQWMDCMRQSLSELDADQEIKSLVESALARVAGALTNR